MMNVQQKLRISLKLTIINDFAGVGKMKLNDVHSHAQNSLTHPFIIIFHNLFRKLLIKIVFADLLLVVKQDAE